MAAENAHRLQLAVTFVCGNWWAPDHSSTAGGNAYCSGLLAPEGHFDLVVSNPPYIAAGDAHLGALQHEPSTALVGGDDGLADLRQIIDGSKNRLAPDAWLLLEHGHDQANALHTMLLQAGFELPQTRNDLAGLPRCTGARWPLHAQT